MTTEAKPEATPTTAPAPPHWLHSLCRPERKNSPTACPWLLTLDGQPWTAATDGRIAVYLAGSHGDALPPPEKVAATLGGILGRSGEGTVLDLASLKAWLGCADLPAEDPPCPECRGTQKVDCDCCDGDGECPTCGEPAKCPDCDGKGMMECSSRKCKDGRLKPEESPARLLGTLLDRVPLARVLAHLEGSTVRTWTPAAAGKPFVLECLPGWKLVVMSLDRAEYEGPGFPGESPNA